MISRINSTLENISTKQSYVKDDANLQTKLMAEQRRLKAVDSDANMSESEKVKEKVRIQQQIDDLNRKLKMEELEKESADTKKGLSEKATEEINQSKESKEKKAEDVEAVNKTAAKEEATSKDTKKIEENKTTKDVEEKDIREKQVEKKEKNKEDEEKANSEKIGVSPQEIYKMLNLDSELQKEQVLNQVSNKKEGSEDVLRAEIKSDKIQGTDIKGKEEKLVEMREKKPIQIEAIESYKKEPLLKPEDGMKIVIK